MEVSLPCERRRCVYCVWSSVRICIVLCVCRRALAGRKLCVEKGGSANKSALLSRRCQAGNASCAHA